MKNNKETTAAMRYEAPVAQSVLLITESFTMQSTPGSLEDYEDNPIFGAPLHP